MMDQEQELFEWYGQEWIAGDMYQDAKDGIIQLALLTNIEGNSCFSN